MTKLKVAMCQAAPIPLDFAGGIEKVTRLAKEAIDNGAQMVAFGETFLGGYPLWLDEVPGAALFNTIEGEQLDRGGSMIIATDARVLAQTGEGEDTLFAELDLSEIGRGLASLDTDGHYSRPDVFELSVDTKAKDEVNWGKGEASRGV